MTIIPQKGNALNLIGQNAGYFFWAVFRIVVGVYAGFIILIFAFQSRLIYFPSRKLVSSPEAIGLAYESVYFDTDDGVKLHSWFIPAENERGVVLFCHGNAGNISYRLSSIEIFHYLGLSVFIFDYRGYGLSEGTTTEQGTYRDVEAAWKYLLEERGYASQKVVVFGRSLGGTIAAYIASQEKPKLLILESTFTSVVDMGRKLYPFLPIRWLTRYRYDAASYLTKVDCPVLVVHSPDDEIIPFDHGKRLYEIAQDPKVFLEIQGGHNEGFMMSQEKYVAGFDSFIGRFLGERKTATTRSMYDFGKIRPGMSYDDIRQVVGEPDRDIGSGIHIFEYDVDDGSRIQIGCPDMNQILYVDQVLPDGTTKRLVGENSK